MSGYFWQGCVYCKEFWPSAKSLKLRKHFAVDCKECPKEVTRKFINLLIVEEESVEPKKKKCKVEFQTTLNFERTKITEARSKEIDNALIKAFVCCNLAFSIIENLFFIELFKTLCVGYNVPSRRKLFIELLEREIIKKQR